MIAFILYRWEMFWIDWRRRQSTGSEVIERITDKAALGCRKKYEARGWWLVAEIFVVVAIGYYFSK